jgi:hypothetical protein
VAIKLLGVTGWKLLDGEEASETQDFLLMSHDRFFVRNVQEFGGFTRAVTSGTVLKYLLGRPFMALRMMKALGKHSSPLEIPYWSVVPYLLGPRAIKYKLRPTSADKTPIPSNPSPDYLRDALWKRLASGPVSFDFMVQVQTDPKKMPVEDPVVAWSEKESPFVKVATLVIPSQKLGDAAVSALQRQAEAMAFNPWRCLPAHRPLGGLNRARRQVYRALSSFRNLRNAARDDTDFPPQAQAQREDPPSEKGYRAA